MFSKMAVAVTAGTPINKQAFDSQGVKYFPSLW